MLDDLTIETDTTDKGGTRSSISEPFDDLVVGKEHRYPV